MIVRDKPTAWEVFFVLRGSIVPRILPAMGGIAVLSLVIVLLHRAGLIRLVPIQPLAISVIGAALAIFAAFRNAAAYDRWWEARKLMGLVVIETRNLARQTVYIQPSKTDDTARRIALRCIAFVYVLGDFLRGRAIGSQAVHYLRPEELPVLQRDRCAPNRLLQCFSADIAALQTAGRLTPVLARMLEERVQGLMTGFAGAERTKATPMPFVYTLLIHRTAYIFCLLLPFGLADSSGYWTPLLAAVISYAFFALDAIGDDLSVPFGDHDYCLPLDAIGRAVEINILQSFDDRDIPEPLKPQNYLLT